MVTDELIKLFALPDVMESYCAECGIPTRSVQHTLCDECEDYIDELDGGFYEEEPDYSDFDCTCGAWQWSEKEGKPIHVADCVCGSNEPWR